MNDIKTKTDNSYYYQQPKDSGPLFACGSWNDRNGKCHFGVIPVDVMRERVEELVKSDKREAPND